MYAQERIISFLGIFALLFLAWLMSSNKKKIPWRVISVGIALQFVLALFILKTTPGQWIFSGIGNFFTAILTFVDAGASFLFGQDFTEHFFAFKILPTIIFFSSLMGVLYYFGVMQFVVKVFAVVMQKLLGTSGAETLATAANIFIGQTEAPLVIKPYVDSMTKSELMTLMVGGFATVAGGVLAAYAGMGIDAGHMVTASVISAPAALAIAKMMQPEVETPRTLGTVNIEIPKAGENAIDALAAGAADGLKLALNVGAMLLAFLAMIALLDAAIAGIGGWFGWNLSLSIILGKAFMPFAYLLGIESADVTRVAELLGLKMVANEFVAYQRLGEWLKEAQPVISERSTIIITYALSGFANFGSIGIQIGGIGPLAPTKKATLASIGFRAMLGGTLAANMTACVAGVLL